MTINVKRNYCADPQATSMPTGMKAISAACVLWAAELSSG